MTDFVTRLESELHAAALRQERRGRVRGVALPRLRIALGELPAVAAATVALALALAVCAVLLSGSPQDDRVGALPGELQGAWRAPPTELRLYDAGSQRCANLGVGSSEACYTIGDSSTRLASEWGTLSLSGRRITLRPVSGSAPGVYRWTLTGGTLRLTRARDSDGARVRALTAMPMRPVERPDQRSVSAVWSMQELASSRFGYSLRTPHFWSLDARGPADRLSGDATSHVLPEVMVTARRLTPGTSAARWGATVNRISESRGCAPYDLRRLVVGGTTIRVSVYRDCGAPHIESATFVHGGRGYRVTWRGKARRPEDDYTRFDALLQSLRFTR